MKRLYLMRHGRSPSLAECGAASDALRPLSERGRRDARRMAEELLRRGGRPELILHSPLARAEQTAREAARALAPARGVRTCAFLDNTRLPEEVAAALEREAAGCAEALAVGHQPQLGELAVLLGRELVELRPAGLIALELGERPRLLWSLNPQ